MDVGILRLWTLDLKCTFEETASILGSKAVDYVSITPEKGLRSTNVTLTMNGTV